MERFLLINHSAFKGQLLLQWQAFFPSPAMTFRPCKNTLLSSHNLASTAHKCQKGSKDSKFNIRIQCKIQFIHPKVNDQDLPFQSRIPAPAGTEEQWTIENKQRETGQKRGVNPFCTALSSCMTMRECKGGGNGEPVLRSSYPVGHWHPSWLCWINIARPNFGRILGHVFYSFKTSGLN